MCIWCMYISMWKVVYHVVVSSCALSLAHTRSTQYMPRLVEQHSGPRAFWECVTEHIHCKHNCTLHWGTLWSLFQRGALRALQQEIKNALGVKRREILSRRTHRFVFPRGHPHISLYVLGGILVFALVPGGLSSGSLALFFPFLFFTFFSQTWTSRSKTGS